MAEKATTIDQYLAAVPADQRSALEKLRKLIRAAAPAAEECISYGIPAFRQDGMLVGFHATKNHCAFFLMNNSTVAQFAELLAPYDTSKGTIRFPADKPLPAALVRQLVQVRLAENAARAAAKSKSKAKPAKAKSDGAKPISKPVSKKAADSPVAAKASVKSAQVAKSAKPANPPKKVEAKAKAKAAPKRPRGSRS